MESRKLSRPTWLATYRDGICPQMVYLPIQVLTGPDVE